MDLQPGPDRSRRRLKGTAKALPVLLLDSRPETHILQYNLLLPLSYVAENKLQGLSLASALDGG
jgi:hypothetical protein